MPRGESRSPSPTRRRSSSREHRRRSQSPRQDTDRPRRKEGGFRWKEKRQNDEGEIGSNGGRRLERGYREHYRARSRSPRRNQDSGDEEQEQKKDKPERPKGERKEKKDNEKKASAVPLSAEPMIIVNVNDRLGTKAAIPCYASDPIKLFKAQVAARIGREPHEILLKRQGERPFKDQLTLEDYGVSNGVQLDLEVDTGD